MNAAPPIIPRSSAANTWFVSVLLAFTGLGAASVVYFFNPATHGFYPVCQFHKLTGWNCPGCGATRACYSLMHGDFANALRDNALFVLAPVAAAVRAGWLFLAYRRGRLAGPLIPGNLAWAFLLVAVVFAILRNLPAFAFLSPA